MALPETMTVNSAKRARLSKDDSEIEDCITVSSRPIGDHIPMTAGGYTFEADMLALQACDQISDGAVQKAQQALVAVDAISAAMGNRRTEPSENRKLSESKTEANYGSSYRPITYPTNADYCPFYVHAAFFRYDPTTS